MRQSQGGRADRFAVPELVERGFKSVGSGFPGYPLMALSGPDCRSRECPASISVRATGSCRSACDAVNEAQGRAGDVLNERRPFGRTAKKTGEGPGIKTQAQLRAP